MMALCGLFAAVTAVCSWISIPLGFTPIPLNLGTLAVYLTGALLGKKYGPISLLVYTRPVLSDCRCSPVSEEA